MSTHNPFHDEALEAVSLEGVDPNAHHNGLATASRDANGDGEVERMKVAVEAPDEGHIAPLQIEQGKIEPTGAAMPPYR